MPSPRRFPPPGRSRKAPPASSCEITTSRRWRMSIMRTRPAGDREAAHAGRGVPDRGEHRQAAKRAATDIEGHSATAKFGQPRRLSAPPEQRRRMCASDWTASGHCKRKSRAKLGASPASATVAVPRWLSCNKWTRAAVRAPPRSHLATLLRSRRMNGRHEDAPSTSEVGSHRHPIGDGSNRIPITFER
jgi:hypothetical protein